MTFKIVSDSASDVAFLPQTPFASVPLMITVGANTFVDDAQLDVPGMMAALKEHRGRSITACPSPDAWMQSFEDAEEVFCFTITSTLSGSCNSAMVAQRDYTALHPERRVMVVDSLSTGPEIALLIEKTAELHQAGHSFEEIQEELESYQQRTHLLFSLQSLRNLANNGRVSPAIAALAGLLGIRVIGCASAKGDLEMLARCRGEKRALDAIYSGMMERGYAGGRVRIAHCGNEPFAQALADAIHARFPDADMKLYPTMGLCSFYAEQGGLLVGFEG